MDFGATLCTRSRPGCARCPFSGDCAAHRDGRSAELPAPRPARALPERSCLLLWLEDAQGRIALPRREGPGVWRGLWSLPEAADARQADAWLRVNLRIEAARVERLPAFLHVFSHYRLQIQPLRVAPVEALPSVSESEGPRWFERAELAGLGLPAPVRRLLDSNP